MEGAVTTAAQDNEIFFAVRPQLASPNYVMDLELIAPATVLAFPAVPLQDFHLQLAVTTVFEPKPTSFGSVHTHADRRISSRNSCCCDAARKPKNRRTDVSSASGLPFSRFAPAIKSAQIISRQ